MSPQKIILKDCFKKYNDKAIGKVIPPEKTCEIILKKLKCLNPPILANYLEVLNSLAIPHTMVIGTDDFQKFTQTVGQNGKGHSKIQALASGLMELVERYSCGKYLKTNIELISSFRDLELKGNPLRLEDILKYPHLRNLEAKEELWTARIGWHKGYTLDEKEVYVPMNLIRYLLEGSNGMAAGNSLEEALKHGICELIERHCRSLIEIRKIKTPFIDKSTIKFPFAKKMINKADSLGQTIHIKDFSLGIGVPVIAVIRKISKTNRTITVGVATDRNEALTRALTESTQAGGNEQVARKISTIKYHFTKNKIISLKDITNISNSNILLEIKNIKKLLDKQHIRIFFVITTDKILNLPCVYVYSPQCKNLFTQGSFRQIGYRNVWMGLILEGLITKNYGSVKKYIGKICQKDKANQAIYWFYQGIYLRRQSRYNEAIPYFLKAKKAVNRMVNLAAKERLEMRLFCIMNLAYCYQAIGNIKKTIYSLLNLYETDSNISFKGICNFYSIGMNPKEKKLFEMAYSWYLDIKTLKEKLGFRKRSEFIKILLKYSKDKEKILMYLKQAHLFFKNEKYTEAITKAKKAKSFNCITDRLYNVPRFIGACYQKMKKFPEAISELKKAEEIDPLDPQINLFLADCLKKQGDIKLSKKERNKASLKEESQLYSFNITKSRSIDGDLFTH